jgi:hypothetical protein
MIVKEGITDISASEGDIKRFSRICKLIGNQKRALSRKKVVELIKNQIGLTNDNVIGRHISILEKVGVLENTEGMYLLSSYGKALFYFVENSNKLNLSEKIFYFNIFFSNIFGQLFLLLITINDSPRESRNNIIIKYFENENLMLWKKKTIMENLKIFIMKKEVSSFFENKFGCMEKWLRELNLVEKKQNSLKLTQYGKRCLEKIDATLAKKGKINVELFEIASSLLDSEAITFNFHNSGHKQNFINLFKEAYLKFVTELNVSDLKAMRMWISVELLIKYNIILEENEFESMFNDLYNEGIVRSIMVDRKGRPSLVTINN